MIHNGYQEVGNTDALTWEAFETFVQADVETALVLRDTSLIQDRAAHSPWIYRGQSNACWPILSSLERYLEKELSEEELPYPFSKYYDALDGIIPFVNTTLGQSFSRIGSEDISNIRYLHSLPYYELLCFTRHLGFPSPLVDWSYSYYIAAFFAFKNCLPDHDVAIFSYKESSGEARGDFVCNPIIHQMGPYVETHARHFKQQSTYTFCSAEIEENLVLKNHQEAVEINPNDHWLKKFILKGSEKGKVLSKLSSMNINDYTLFGDEESLMRTLTYQAFQNPYY